MITLNYKKLLVASAILSAAAVSGTVRADDDVSVSYQIKTFSQKPISEQDIAERNLEEYRNSVIGEVSKLNLKDQKDNTLRSIEQSWSKAEVDSRLSKAKALSSSNDQADSAEAQAKEAERARKAEEEAKKAKEEAAKKAAEAKKVNNSQSTDTVTAQAATASVGAKSFGPNQAREAFEQITADLGVTGSEKQIWADIITKESGWNVYATNPGSGAYGLPQSLPGSKMASVGGDYLTNPYTQLTWMYKYVHERYGSFAGVNWYSRGWY